MTCWCATLNKHYCRMNKLVIRINKRWWNMWSLSAVIFGRNAHNGFIFSKKHRYSIEFFSFLLVGILHQGARTIVIIRKDLFVTYISFRLWLIGLPFKTSAMYFGLGFMRFPKQYNTHRSFNFVNIFWVYRNSF